MEVVGAAEAKTEEGVLPPPQQAPDAPAASPAAAAESAAPAASPAAAAESDASAALTAAAAVSTAPAASPAGAADSVASAAPAASLTTAATSAYDSMFSVPTPVLETFEYNFELSQNLAPDSVHSMHRDLLLSDTPANPRFVHHGPSIVWLYDEDAANARNENQSLADSMKPLPLLPFLTFGMMPTGDSLLLASVLASELEAVIPDPSDELGVICKEWAQLARRAYDGPRLKADADQDLAFCKRFRKL